MSDPIIHYINWGNLPCEDLGNITQDELNFLSESSAVDRHDEDFDAFLKYVQNGPADTGLPMIDGDEKIDVSEMDRIEIESLPEDTRKQMYQHGQRFRDFLEGENLRNIQHVNNPTLNQYLRYFYFKLKKQDGSFYSPASLICIRAGIQRFLRMVLKLPVDIIGGEEFNSCNEMLRVKVRDFHRDGGCTRQYEPIEEGDMQKLRCYFEGTTAEIEQAKFLFYVLYSFGERGQEHLKFLRQRDSLELHTDSDGKEYYCLPALPTKNKSADPVKAKARPDNKQARIYDTAKVRRYLQLLPPTTKDNHLFPRPLSNTDSNGQPMFSTKQNRGENYFLRFMRNLSEKAGLSKMYTNHCIRVSRIADLEAAGYNLADIMSITGQVSERTTRRYLSKRRDRSLQSTSEAVSMALDLNGSSQAVATPLRESSPVPVPVSSSVQITGISHDNPSVRYSFHNCSFNGCKFE